MKQTCKKWWQAVLDFLDENPTVAKTVSLAFSIGFVLVALGVMMNLAGSASLIELAKNFFIK